MSKLRKTKNNKLILVLPMVLVISFGVLLTYSFANFKSIKTFDIISSLFKGNVYTLSYDDVSCNSKSITNGSAFGELCVPEVIDGYTFDGWYFNDQLVTASDIVNTNNDIQLVGHFLTNCNYEAGAVFNYDYTGSVQEFLATCPGSYRLEVWGAQGGDANGTYVGGNGAYAKGELDLTSNTKLYVNVGGKGATCGGSAATCLGGYNGGGSAKSYTNGSSRAAGGGGATDIRIGSDQYIYTDILTAREYSNPFAYYGPYVYAGAGRYQADVYGTNLNNINAYDASYNRGGNQLTMSNTHIDSTHIIHYFNLTSADVSNMLPIAANGDSNGLEVRGRYQAGISNVPTATKIVISNLDNRVIVGAGGGGGHYTNDSNCGKGGIGGTTTGGTPTSMCPDNTKCSTTRLSVGGKSNAISCTANNYNCSDFGRGGDSDYMTEHDGAGSGGGGGYYGGSGANVGAGGGGSSYTGTLTSSQMIAGNGTMPKHDGTTNTMTGNTGNGYARITYLGNFITVNFDAGDGTGSETSRRVVIGSPLGDLPTAEKIGYTFDGWYTDPDNGNKIYSTTRAPQEDTTYYAHYVVNQYAFTKETQKIKYGTVSGDDNGTYDYGSSITITATPKTGYIFVGWVDDEEHMISTSPSYTFTMPAGNLNLTATFTFDMDSITNINVLNVYPYTGQSTTFQSWMNNYGQGKITVTPVYIDSFNSNPSQYLGTSGNWNYDVIVFGFRDSNESKDLSAASASLTGTFIDEGHGVIFGHDTFGNTSSCNHPNFNTLRSKVMLGTSASRDKRSTKIKIVKQGIFTSYPYNIGSVGTQLTIPESHVLDQTANGDIWLQFVGDVDDNRNFYLTTYKNAAMIQTGHSNGSATADEQKILANIIFYLYSYDLMNRD